MDDFNVELIKKSPLDSLGYKTSCCFCCSLKVATVFICGLTFFWAVMEVTMAEKSLKNIFSNKSALQILTIVYILFSILLMVAAGILMLGIILEKNILVNLFVMYGLIYLCVSTLLLIVSTAFLIVNKGKLEPRTTFKLMLSVLWSCFFFYFLIIVNSYKTTLW